MMRPSRDKIIISVMDQRVSNGIRSRLIDCLTTALYCNPVLSYADFPISRAF